MTRYLSDENPEDLVSSRTTLNGGGAPFLVTEPPKKRSSIHCEDCGARLPPRDQGRRGRRCGPCDSAAFAKKQDRAREYSRQRLEAKRKDYGPGVLELGRAAMEAGLTLEDIHRIAAVKERCSCVKPANHLALNCSAGACITERTG